jgi:hypothetical protein
MYMDDRMRLRRQRRREFMAQLYNEVDGSVSEFVSGLELGARLGIDEPESHRIMAYLEEKGLVLVDDHRAAIIRITADGVDFVETSEDSAGEQVG